MLRISATFSGSADLILKTRAEELWALVRSSLRTIPSTTASSLVSPTRMSRLPPVSGVMSVSAVSHHLRQLRQLRLVQVPGGIRIAWKRVDLINCDAPLDGLTQPF